MGFVPHHKYSLGGKIIPGVPGDRIIYAPIFDANSDEEAVVAAERIIIERLFEVSVGESILAVVMKGNEYIHRFSLRTREV